VGYWGEQFRNKIHFSANATPGTVVTPEAGSLSRCRAEVVSKVSQGVPGVTSVKKWESLFSTAAESAPAFNLKTEATPPTASDTFDAYDAALTAFCDFETRNTGGCDLTKVGSWRYAVDPATEILCFGYRVDGVDHSWSPTSVSRNPLERLAANPGMTFVCFGGFEPIVWQKIMVDRHGFPPIPTEQWLDLRATCARLALPRALDKALTALGLKTEKDMEGQRLVRSLSKPNRKTGVYPELTPLIDERVAAYNRIDILALEAMRKQGLGRLDPAERKVWELDQKINARGIKIDVGFVEAAKKIAGQAMGEAVAEFITLTNGIVPTKTLQIREWLRDNRCALPDLESETIEEALESGGLPDNVRRALEIRQIVAAASLKKLDAMLAVVESDGRARGLLQYHGASTGRWSGQLIQPQNFPRSTLKTAVDPEALAAAVKTGNPDALVRWGKPVDVLVSGLRCALTAADDSMLGAGDFSMIEACVLLALAGQHDKCKLIAQGVDIYRDMAATIFGLDREAFMAIPEDRLSPDETEQRRIGKNAVLGCGYQIGAEGFHRRFCRHVEDGKTLATRIVGVYRNRWAPMVPKLWRDLESAARRAMLLPGKTIVARCGVTYELTTRAGLPCLVSTLPSGRKLFYANARLDGVDKFGRPRWSYNAYKQGRWETYEPWGGQLTENVVSGLARDLLVHAMFALEAAGYPIVFTVHDEIVVEAPNVAKEDLERIMSERPEWAEKLGVPLKVKAWVGRCYQKPEGAPLGVIPEAMGAEIAETMERPPAARLAPVRRAPAVLDPSMSILHEYFAGIGMARLGFGPRWATMFSNDISAIRSVAYRSNFGDGEFIEGDIAGVKPSDIPGRADCAWISSPCTGFSQAGNELGLADPESAAFWPAWGLIEAQAAEGRAPLTIGFENVPRLATPRFAKDFADIKSAFTRTGFGYAVFYLDAASFLPQSRKRLFIAAAYGASNAFVQSFVDEAMRGLNAMPPRAVGLNDFLNFDSRFRGYGADKIAHHLSMLSPASVELIAEARMIGRPVAFAFARRTRYRLPDGTYVSQKTPGATGVQQVELRKGDIANAFRVAKKGGSSFQFLLFVDGDRTYVRAIDPNEAMALMGMPATYKPLSDPVEMLSACGDGVAVDVVRFIAERIIEPMLKSLKMARAAQ
jgi:site-specific DNA-cytosine methylase